MKKQEKAKPKSSIAAFLELRAVRFAVGVVCLGLAYAFASWAIDTGSLLDYAITLLLIIAGVKELWAAVRSQRKTGEQ